MTKAKKPAAAPAPADTVALIPLASLCIHPLNVRSEPPAADIEALAESIGDLGLLQNLAGYIDPTYTDGSVGIVAGGRRLRALILLATRDGRDPASTTVPVRLTDSEETARLWASAENAAREALHPADEVRAYGRMAATGADPDRIAKAFAVTVRHVRQRLRLAQLPEPALDALRGGEITLDQAGALTMARDDEALMKELTLAKENQGYSTSADSIRNRLANASVRVTDRRVQFIGRDAYREAGGRVQEDLFTSDVRLLDEDILDQLFVDKLTKSAEAELQTTGWKWVEILTDAWAPYALSTGLQKISRVPVDLPEADLEELQKLADLAEVGEISAVEQDRFEELEHRAAGDYADTDIATSGLWLYVDNHGGLNTHGPYRRPEDDPDREQAEESEAAVTIAKPESAALSAGIAEDLKRVRLAALQIAVSHDASLTWDLLAWQLSGTIKSYAPALGITLARQTVSPEKTEGYEPPASLTAGDAVPYELETSADIETFEIWRAKSSIEKGQITSLAIARSIIDGRAYLPLLAALSQPVVRRIWTPTASAFFSRLPVARLDAIWAELVPDTLEPSHAKFRAEKKGDKAQLLHKLFNSADFREAIGTSREMNKAIDTWLPPELQWPEVEDEGGAAA